MVVMRFSLWLSTSYLLIHAQLCGLSRKKFGDHIQFRMPDCITICPKFPMRTKGGAAPPKSQFLFCLKPIRVTTEAKDFVVFKQIGFAQHIKLTELQQNWSSNVESNVVYYLMTGGRWVQMPNIGRATSNDAIGVDTVLPKAMCKICIFCPFALRHWPT